MDKPIAVEVNKKKVLDKELTDACGINIKISWFNYKCYDIHNTWSFVTYDESILSLDENTIIHANEVQDLLNPTEEELNYLELTEDKSAVEIYLASLPKFKLHFRGHNYDVK